MDDIGKILREYLFKKGIVDNSVSFEISSNWGNIIGEKLSKKVKFKRFKYNKLYISVDNASIKQELYYFKSDIINNIYKYTNIKEVSDIVIT